jgi:predicted flap endonuclease-1-like 5' DNA nuclease
VYYLISQILLALLFTAALGVIAGWLLRGVGVGAQLAALEREREQQRRRANALEERLAAVQAAQRATPPPPAGAAAPHAPLQAGASEALSALRERLGQLDAVARSQAERLAELGQRLREKDALLDRLTPATQPQAPAAGPAQPNGLPPAELLAQRPERADRLQAISGIGPVLESVLNELGIYRFRQLARLTPANIEWLASRINWFPQRIQREDWVGQARRLHAESHPDEEL